MSRWLGRRSGHTKAFLVAISLIAFTVLLLPSGFTAGSAVPTKMDRQAVAQHLLETAAPRFMTAPAQVALHIVATGDNKFAPGLAPGPEKRPGAALAGGGLAPTAPAFSNVRVNDPSRDTHQDDQTTQSETSIAVAGSNVAVGYNDSQNTPLFLTAASNLSGYSYSSDGGATFTDGGVIPNAPEFNNFGDPWLTSDRAGNMYYATLAFDAFNFNGDVSVAKSTDGGRTWSDPIPTLRPPIEIFYFGDKEAMTAGPDPDVKSRDDLYVAWDDFFVDLTNCCQLLTGLPVAHSIDGGATWQVVYADRIANPEDTCSFSQYIGAQPIVDPRNGALYVAAEKISVDDPDCVGIGVPVQLSEVIFKSTDGGQTFGPGVKIADVTQSVPNGLLELGPGRYMRNLEFPTLAIFGGAIYVAWNDGGTGNSHVRLAKSTDAGKTWSLSWATQGSNDEVQPALSADTGGLHLLFYRRNNNNTLDVFVANSANGTAFVTRRVTTRSFPGVITDPQFDPIIAFFYMGDYIANVSDGQHQYFAWGDNRDTVTDFFWPSGRNDPNVYFARQ
jgi:hypothetical protein